MKSTVKFADEKVAKAFENLRYSEEDGRRLHKFLSRAFADLARDAYCGIQVRKRLIPKEYIKKYEINNLWKYNLPGAWRLLYSVGKDGVTVVSIILEWLNHKDYERRFGY